MSGISLCPCGSKLNQSDCCAIYHAGMKAAPTAEALMRSRYSAYVMKNDDYLLTTWDSSKRPGKIDFSKEEDVKWGRLEIIKKKKGGEKDTKGVVEFKAFYTVGEDEYVMNEISRFVKKEGEWLYLDGVVKSTGKVNQQTNLGKNSLCSCGSGKKFKRCCGK